MFASMIDRGNLRAAVSIGPGGLEKAFEKLYNYYRSDAVKFSLLGALSGWTRPE